MGKVKKITLAVGKAGRSRRRVAAPADESGIALVMALGIMFVLTILVTSTLLLTGASQRQVNRSNAAQKAGMLAEAGIAAAGSVLYGAKDPASASAVPSGSRVTSEGTVTWSGSLTGTTWTLTGTGTVKNPAGAAGETFTKTVTKRYTITLTPQPAWFYNYSDTLSGCMDVANNAVVTTPLYVRGNMCMGNNSHFTGSELQVKGTLTVNNNASVGYAGAPIATAKLQGGCMSPAHTCTSADRVYATSLTTTADAVSKPAVNMPTWYANAEPGPSHSCTTGSIAGGFDNDSTYNNSRAGFDLTPDSSYSCVVTRGGTAVAQLSWNSSTGVLAVSGTIFFDGPLQVSSSSATYTGIGTIYSAGTITLPNNAKLCGVPACDSSWNPNTNLIVFVAGASSGTGFLIDNNAVYQGAAYVVADYSLSNNASNWGPVIADSFDLANNSGGFKPVASLPSGAPGTSWTISELPGGWTG
jgi:hypothetical protein